MTAVAESATGLRTSIRVRAKTLGALALLAVALPANLAVTATALLLHPRRRRPEPATQRMTILVTGGKMTKSLHLARTFHRAGHRVVLAEAEKYRLSGHRFSRCVDAFHTVPPPTAPDFTAAIAAVVEREGIDLWVPVSSPASSVPEADAAVAIGVPAVHGDPSLVRRLDDKAELSVMVAEAGLPTPDSHRVIDPAHAVEVLRSSHRRYVIKSIPYDPVHRLDLTPLPRPTMEETERFLRSKPISADRPWVLQELLDGDEYCTHSTAVDGELQAHICCRSSAFQVNYEAVDHPAIEAWVRQFVAAHRITGQVSFDLIEAPDGTIRAIECNPRTHSAITVIGDHLSFTRAYVERNVPTVTPRTGDRPTYWLYHELWRMLSRPQSIPERIAVVRRGRDAIFDWRDPLPFLLVHHLQIPSLLLSNLRRSRDWVKVDFNIGKLVEPAGD